jgi:hypothetical protein
VPPHVTREAHALETPTLAFMVGGAPGGPFVDLLLSSVLAAGVVRHELLARVSLVRVDTETLDPEVALRGRAERRNLIESARPPAFPVWLVHDSGGSEGQRERLLEQLLHPCEELRAVGAVEDAVVTDQ